MGHWVPASDGAGVAAQDNDMPEAPRIFEQNLLNYQRYITNLKKTGNFLMGQMANADETAIYLDMPPNYTLEKKGVNEKLLKTTEC